MLELINECLKMLWNAFLRLTVQWGSWPILHGHRWRRRAAASTARCPARWHWLLGPIRSLPSPHNCRCNTGEEKRNRNICWLNILEWDRGKRKKAERENDIDSESRKDWATLLCIYICGFDVTTERKMKWGPRGALVTLPWNINHTARTQQHCKGCSSTFMKTESFPTKSTAGRSNRISAKDITQSRAVNTWSHFSPHLWVLLVDLSQKWNCARNSHPSTDTDTDTARNRRKLFSSLKTGCDFRARTTAVVFFPHMKHPPIQLFLAKAACFLFHGRELVRVQRRATEPAPQTWRREAAGQPVDRWMHKTLLGFRLITCCSLLSPLTFT